MNQDELLLMTRRIRTLTEHTGNDALAGVQLNKIRELVNTMLPRLEEERVARKIS
jgi:hypothetical protein